MVINMKMFYAGNMRFGEVMVRKNTKNDAPERAVVARMRANSFGNIGVLADVIDPDKRYHEQDDARIVVTVQSKQVEIANSDSTPTREVPERFRTLVRDMFGNRPATEKCDMQQVPITRVCEHCKQPRTEYVYREVAKFSTREDRCGFTNFSDTFKIPLENFAILVAPTLNEVIAFEAGQRVVSAVFVDNQVKLIAQCDSPIYTFATSFAFDGFNVAFTEFKR